MVAAEKSTKESMDRVLKVACPGQFSFVPEEWPKYKTQFLKYMALSGNNECNDQNKTDCLLYFMGIYIWYNRAKDIIIQFEKKLKYEELLQKFDDLFTPKKNVIYERYIFNIRIQKEGETFHEFVINLQKLAEYCEYGALKEQLIRDRIVIGVDDKKVSDRLLLKNDLSLAEAVQIRKLAEIQREEYQVMITKKDVVVKVDMNEGIEYEVSFCENVNKNMIEVNIFQNKIYKQKVNFLINTGVDISAIPDHVAVENKFCLTKKFDVVKGADGTRLKVIGTISDIEL